MRQRVDVPRPLARKLERLAEREAKAQEALDVARTKLAEALADAHEPEDDTTAYSVGALAEPPLTHRASAALLTHPRKKGRGEHEGRTAGPPLVSESVFCI